MGSFDEYILANDGRSPSIGHSLDQPDFLLSQKIATFIRVDACMSSVGGAMNDRTFARAVSIYLS